MVAKLTDKQKFEKYRQNVAKQYNDRINELEYKVVSLSNKTMSLEKELENKNKQIEDMQQSIDLYKMICNMSDKEIAEMKRRNEQEALGIEAVKHIFGRYTNII